MKRTILALLLTGLFCCNAYAEEKKPEHYCDDKDGWQQWFDMIQKNPDDDDLHTAYALRLGLCQEIKMGTIETDRAIRIFDDFLEALKTSRIQAPEEQDNGKTSL